MRTAPPVVVSLRPEPAWRVASAALACLTAVSLGAWAWLLINATASLSALGLVTVGALALAVGAVAWGQGHGGPFRLAWTGQEWRVWPSTGEARRVLGAWPGLPDASRVDHHTGLPGDPADPSHPCSPGVMIDLGSWMLLRLGVRRGLGCPDWVAVSAGELGLAWHGLRVALYCAPPSRPS